MSAPSFAVLVKDLYVADVYVTSESEAQRLSGARAGLLQVLVRVSGTQAVADDEQIRLALRNPSRFYYQYSYQTTDREFQVGTEIIQGRILRISFEPNSIAALLRNAGFSVWGSNRPSVLLWVAVNDERGRRIMTESDGDDISRAFSELAKERGLPMLYPLMDLEDAAGISAAEVWGAFLGRIDGASVRYNPDSILSGRVQRDASGQWRGNWTYRIDGNWSQFEGLAGSSGELVVEVVDQLADKLATRYAVGSSKSSVTVRIESVDSAEAYAAVLLYLQSLAPVLDTYVASVEGSDLVLELSTEGQQSQLIEIIELDHKMTLLNASDDRLLYRWIP
ncbi:MAG: hypothetical protein ACJAXW_001796 [Candidatus Azotimanducaceae bacterium]|jgi:hypothetical protein